MPTFNELSPDKLLRTCQNALTQNGLECIHAMLWKIVPKRQYAGEAAYVLAVALTAGYFNDGQLAFNYSIYKTLGISTPCESSATTWHRPPHTSDGRVLQQRSVKDKEKRHKEVEDAFQKQEGTTYTSSKFLDTQTRPQRLCKHCKLHVIYIRKTNDVRLLIDVNYVYTVQCRVISHDYTTCTYNIRMFMCFNCDV